MKCADGELMRVQRDLNTAQYVWSLSKLIGFTYLSGVPNPYQAAAGGLQHMDWHGWFVQISQSLGQPAFEEIERTVSGFLNWHDTCPMIYSAGRNITIPGSFTQTSPGGLTGRFYRTAEYADYNPFVDEVASLLRKDLSELLDAEYQAEGMTWWQRTKKSTLDDYMGWKIFRNLPFSVLALIGNSHHFCGSHGGLAYRQSPTGAMMPVAYSEGEMVTIVSKAVVGDIHNDVTDYDAIFTQCELGIPTYEELIESGKRN